jgi:uncharacterized protein (DUF488 family)
VKRSGERTCVFTIGHSTHTAEMFLALLRDAGITAVADVRSAPYSRYLPQFNQDVLSRNLQAAGISYAFLGKELGGRPRERESYNNGVADYERMAASQAFREGIRRVVEGAKQYRIALMCSEHDPLDCHRCLLVSRRLAAAGVSVRHILADGSIKTHEEIEDRLLELTHRSAADLFAPREERLAIAYRERAQRVAYSESISGQDA